MAIKKQCVDCIHYTPIDFCSINGINISYDGYNCHKCTKQEDNRDNVNTKSTTNENSFVSKNKMFQSPFSFKGRIRRTEYSLSWLIFLIYFFSMGLIVDKDLEDGFLWVFVLIWLILFIPMIWFVYAQGAKRCHDKGMSGWRQVYVFSLIWLFFAKGDEGVNIYGAPPK
jgi:uncharacterized membrane protein YhaH (DUF805 family)